MGRRCGRRKRASKPTGFTVEAWNKRMLAFKGPAQPSPTLSDALNAGYSYLEVRCLGCDTNQAASRCPSPSKGSSVLLNNHSASQLLRQP
jgi:hypothetical protein